MRHGETDWNKQYLIQGSTDIPLNENGIRMTQVTASGIKADGITFDVIYSSPLDRARKTAEIIKGDSDLPVIIDDRIREFGFGEAEGVTYDELKTNPKFSNLKNWFLKPEDYEPELGAESYDEFFGRLQDFLDNQIKPLENKYESVLLTCHGGVVRGLLKIISKWDVKRFSETKIPNCGLNLVTLKDGQFTVEYTAKVFY